ncbi:Putative ribonuclease H protein At1g65750 [Linum perenne]
MLTTTKPVELENVMVSDLLIPGCMEWDEEHVAMLFNDRDAACILSMPLPRQVGRDVMIWHFSKDGNYSVRSAYRVYMDKVVRRTYLNVPGEWPLLWKMKIPPKVKHFMWNLGRDVLSTKEALHRRHIFVAGECGCCNVFFETSWHLFFECQVAKACWVEAGLSSVVESALGGRNSVAEVILHILGTQEESVTQSFCMVLWSVWQERNARVWTMKASEVCWVVRMGSSLLYEWLKVRGNNNQADEQRRGSECKRWHPPRPGEFKCNLDAAIMAATERSGAGMVIRDNEGELLRYRMVPWGGTWRSKEAEGRALLEALSWVEQQGYTRMNFESDAQVVVNAIGSQQDDVTEFGDIMQGCRAILRRNSEFNVSFVRRGGNGVAHALARHAITLSEPATGEEAPFWLHDVLLDVCLIDHES